ncbi:hypothetical protein [Pleionea sp. CnH1-48]|uniref:hypothetical protein n=1 Tax=Pleionea sp. CnH1-48 TaxID=2954494 RepID=UPI002097A67F|nr:hypothetical protein [Pleionea sp. CnH1-48]MCO7223403.1 hypothetical protein [Pleionea sp. CnH1-48]
MLKENINKKIQLLANKGPSEEHWNQITVYLDALSDRGFEQEAVDAFSSLLDSWPDSLRQAPRRWVKWIIEQGALMPRWQLVKALALEHEDEIISSDMLSNLTWLQTGSFTTPTEFFYFDGAKGLGYLECRGNTYLDDSALLKHATKLRFLDISASANLTEVDSLAKCKQLETLILRDMSALVKIDGIHGLPIRHLILQACDHLIDTHVIASLMKLEELELSVKASREVTYLKALPLLKKLNLQVEDNSLTAKDLSSLQTLKELSVKKIKLNSLSELAELTHLEQFSCLEDSGITELDFSKPLSRLFYLQLAHHQHLTSMQGKGISSHLRHLSLPHCHALKSLDGIERFAELEYLELTLNPQLEDISALKSLKHLKYLTLSGCEKIVDGSVLAEISNLEELVVVGCSSLKGVRELTGVVVTE